MASYDLQSVDNKIPKIHIHQIPVAIKEEGFNKDESQKTSIIARPNSQG